MAGWIVFVHLHVFNLPPPFSAKIEFRFYCSPWCFHYGWGEERRKRAPNVQHDSPSQHWWNCKLVKMKIDWRTLGAHKWHYFQYPSGLFSENRLATFRSSALKGQIISNFSIKIAKKNPGKRHASAWLIRTENFFNILTGKTYWSNHSRLICSHFFCCYATVKHHSFNIFSNKQNNLFKMNLIKLRTHFQD